MTVLYLTCLFWGAFGAMACTATSAENPNVLFVGGLVTTFAAVTSALSDPNGIDPWPGVPWMRRKVSPRRCVKR